MKQNETQFMMDRRGFLAGAAAAMVIPASHAAAKSAITSLTPKGSAGFDHSAFSAILAQHVKRDRRGYHKFDYAGLKGNSAPLTAYLDALTAADPTAMSADEAHAYWINLYNAKTLDVVIEHYPVSSIKKINLGGGGLFGSGPWSKPLINVAGQNLSLDDVEHRIVRGLFNDPMSHYGLNCASYSCPNLAQQAYTGANLNSLLADMARDYVGHSRGVRVKRGRITASKIYSWYADDFGGEEQLKPHWQQFASEEKSGLIAEASIRRYTYDWSLNDV